MGTTPNMGLVLPDLTTPGDLYALLVDAALTTVDAHDHTSGKGVQLGIGALDIDGALNFNGHYPSGMQGLSLELLAANLSTSFAGMVYMVGGDLYYNNGAGGQVQVTSGNGVTGGAGTITGLPSGTAGASYSSPNYTFISATSISAGLDAGTLIVRKASTLGAAGAFLVFGGTADVTVTLPLVNVTLPTSLPGTTQLLVMDSSGNVTVSGVSASTGRQPLVVNTAGTPSALPAIPAALSLLSISAAGAPGTVASSAAVEFSPALTLVPSSIGIALQSAVPYAIAASSTGSFSSSSALTVPVTNATITFTVIGGSLNHPVVIVLTPDGTSNPALISGGTFGSPCVMSLLRDGVVIGVVALPNNTPVSPPSSVCFKDTNASAGSHTYSLTVTASLGATVHVSNCVLAGYQL